MSGKYVYFFGEGEAEGNAGMKNLLGGKGANLAEMTNLGIRVPAGFTITTEICTIYQKEKKYPDELKKYVEENIAKVEKAMNARFGDSKDPLLVSVRSGARVSMPGMMDTVLNLGLNDETVKGLASKAQDERFAYDCYRRFIQMYGEVVMDIKPAENERDPFDLIIEEKRKERGVKLDTELTTVDWQDIIVKFKKLIQSRAGKSFPENPIDQLWGAIGAVFESWHNDRAIEYRRINNIPGNWGTAVNVQSMVYGNMGENSATGVAFTRDPATGEKKFFGEFLPNAQGEDVVAGIRTPQPINKADKKDVPVISLEEMMPDVYSELVDVYHKLEQHYKEMQDIEFTIQQGKLYLLQTRTGKRTVQAAVRIAVEMAQEGLIDKKTAISRVAPEQLDKLLHPMIDPKAKVEVLANGLPASPGAASGKIVFSAEDAVAEKEKNQKEKVVLVRWETSPEDIAGMNVAEGILTAHGGLTSHAAVVARGMGKPCVAGCGALGIDYGKQEMKAGGKTFKRGDELTIDGSTGAVIAGRAPTVQPEVGGTFGTLLGWGDEIAKLYVRANADTPKDAEAARKFGAKGIGLCRTEHMFFGADRIKAMREMILADSMEDKKKALAKVLPYQKQDFIGIFKAMEGLPVTIRLFDPPLHEFLPRTEDAMSELAKETGIPVEKIAARARAMHEANPMLGHRGCRLGITNPEITEMQARAIMEAACELAKQGVKVIPEIMVPLTTMLSEFKNQKELIVKVAEETQEKYSMKVEYTVGTMIETPRAALVADEIAKDADFFSFGTNDLTQMTFGFSRDDAEHFLPYYIDKGIISANPFMILDQSGVGQLVKMGTERGRKTKPGLKVGICGEHGGEPSSVKFCHRVGMNYVSCSPFRVPVARLALAHAALEEGLGEPTRQ